MHVIVTIRLDRCFFGLFLLWCLLLLLTRGLQLDLRYFTELAQRELLLHGLQGAHLGFLKQNK